jgi:hypothetical protein
VRLSIVVPVYNEATTIAAVVTAARAYGPVVVVDDGSTDGSAVLAAAAGAAVVRQARRRGKGAALLTGVAAARARGATLVATLDGDGQHRPRDLPRLVRAAAETPGALVIGGRLHDPLALPAGRLAAIRVAGFFVAWITGLPVRDSQCGFRLYPLALLDDVRPRRGGFVLETEVLCQAAARGWPVVEVPVTVLARGGRRSRFRPVLDGAAITAYIAARTIARWPAELGAGAREIARLFSRERRMARHADMLAAGTACGEAGFWAAAGATALRRGVRRLVGWWRHPRRVRAGRVAVAMLAAPGLLVAVVVQMIVGRVGLDVVRPLVDALYAQERLDVRPRAPRIAEGVLAAEEATP